MVGSIVISVVAHPSWKIARNAFESGEGSANCVTWRTLERARNPEGS